MLANPKQPVNNFRKLGDGLSPLAKAGSGSMKVEINGEHFMANVFPPDHLGWGFSALIKQDEVMTSASRLT